MKPKWIVAGVVLAGGLSVGVFDAQGLHEISASVEIRAEADFYSPLETHGAWVEVESYGRCWHPAGVEVTWRPYCAGTWVWTDCGWYWVSDEPWAWACYHYGRWVYHPRFAWIWVPGVEWGPAWVTWRVGGGFVGWAPLPPRVEFGHDGVIAARVEAAPERFVFVESGRFHERITPSAVIVNNRTVVEKTSVVTNIRRTDKAIAGGAARTVVVNEGPGLKPMQQATGQKVRTAEIREVVRQTPLPASVNRGEKHAAEPPAGAATARPDNKDGAPADRAIERPGGHPPADDNARPPEKKQGGEGRGKGKGKGKGPRNE